MRNWIKAGILFVIGGIAQRILDRILDWSEVSLLPAFFSDVVLVVGILIGAILIGWGIYTSRLEERRKKAPPVAKSSEGRVEKLAQLDSLIQKLTAFATEPTPWIPLFPPPPPIIEEESIRLNLLAVEAKELLGSSLNMEDFTVNPDILKRTTDSLGHVHRLAAKLLGEVKYYRIGIQREHEIAEPTLLSKLGGRKLDDLRIALLFPSYYRFLPSRMRRYPPSKRLLLKFSTKEAFDSPLHDLELIGNEIVDSQGYIRRPLESVKGWSKRHGYTYIPRRYTETELTGGA